MHSYDPLTADERDRSAETLIQQAVANMIIAQEQEFNDKVIEFFGSEAEALAMGKEYPDRYVREIHSDREVFKDTETGRGFTIMKGEFGTHGDYYPTPDHK
jgi:hypothetical protein